jgi:hypothetical protein
MKANLAKPCNDCPFRKNSLPGWLGPWETPLELHRFVMAENEFPCHKTMTDEFGDDVPEHKQSYCRGAILYMKKNSKMPSYNSDLRELVCTADRADCKNILSVPDFIQHHQKA